MSVSLNSVYIFSIKPIGILMRNIRFPPVVNTYLSFGNCCKRNLHNVKIMKLHEVSHFANVSASYTFLKVTEWRVAIPVFDKGVSQHTTMNYTKKM